MEGTRRNTGKIRSVDRVIGEWDDEGLDPAGAVLCSCSHPRITL